MPRFVKLLAQVENLPLPNGAAGASKAGHSGWLEQWPLFAAVLGLGLLLLLWARFVRRKQRFNAAEGQGEEMRIRRRSRRSSHSPRPRNPTLAETGGLPPVRSDASAPTPPSASA